MHISLMCGGSSLLPGVDCTISPLLANSLKLMSNEPWLTVFPLLNDYKSMRSSVVPVFKNEG